MTPRFAKKLKSQVQSGRLQVHTDKTIVSQHCRQDTQLWTIETEPPTDLPTFDHVYFATGTHIDVGSLEVLQTMNRKHAIETYGGFPALTDDLKWSDDVPLFLTGKLATLQIGPGAANLEGARLSAERIAWAIEEIFDGHSGSEGEDDSFDEQKHRYFAGIGSRYDQLGEE